MAIEVSVLVAVRNDPEGARATLDALTGQTLRAADFEVLVVDDASTDSTAEAVAAHPRAVLLRRPVRGGAYVARNQALAAAQGSVLAVTDAGCVPDATWLERGLARVRREERAVVAGRIAMPLGHRPTLAAMVDVIHHLDQERYVKGSGYAVTANLIVPEAAFAEVGVFNEDLRSSGDAEWTGRARVAGYEIVYAPEVVVVHPPRTTAREILRKSRRVAEGGSVVRRSGGGPSRSVRPYLHPYVVVPRNRRRGRLRVEAGGASPGALRWLAVGVAQLALVQLPQAFWALVSDVRAALRR